MLDEVSVRIHVELLKQVLHLAFVAVVRNYPSANSKTTYFLAKRWFYLFAIELVLYLLLSKLLLPFPLILRLLLFPLHSLPLIFESLDFRFSVLSPAFLKLFLGLGWWVFFLILDCLMITRYRCPCRVLHQSLQAINTSVVWYPRLLRLRVAKNRLR